MKNLLWVGLGLGVVSAGALFWVNKQSKIDIDYANMHYWVWN